MKNIFKFVVKLLFIFTFNFNNFFSVTGQEMLEKIKVPYIKYIKKKDDYFLNIEISNQNSEWKITMSLSEIKNSLLVSEKVCIKFVINPSHQTLHIPDLLQITGRTIDEENYKRQIKGKKQEIIKKFKDHVFKNKFIEKDNEIEKLCCLLFKQIPTSYNDGVLENLTSGLDLRSIGEIKDSDEPIKTIIEKQLNIKQRTDTLGHFNQTIKRISKKATNEKISTSINNLLQTLKKNISNNKNWVSDKEIYFNINKDKRLSVFVHNYPTSYSINFYLYTINEKTYEPLKLEMFIFNVFEGHHNDPSIELKYSYGDDNPLNSSSLKSYNIKDTNKITDNIQNFLQQSNEKNLVNISNFLISIFNFDQEISKITNEKQILDNSSTMRSIYLENNQQDLIDKMTKNLQNVTINDLDQQESIIEELKLPFLLEDTSSNGSGIQPNTPTTTGNNPTNGPTSTNPTKGTGEQKTEENKPFNKWLIVSFIGIPIIIIMLVINFANNPQSQLQRKYPGQRSSIPKAINYYGQGAITSF